MIFSRSRVLVEGGREDSSLFVVVVVVVLSDHEEGLFVRTAQVASSSPVKILAYFFLAEANTVGHDSNGVDVTAREGPEQRYHLPPPLPFFALLSRCADRMTEL